MSTFLIDNLREQLTAITQGRPWIDETLHIKLDGVSEEEAFAQPLPDVHSVGELVSHLREWRVSVLSTLRERGGTMTSEGPFNWIPLKILKRMGWEKLRAAFFDSQTELLAFLEAHDDAFLNHADPQTGRANRYLIEGLLHHDLYHLGQIGLVLKMVRMEKA